MKKEINVSGKEKKGKKRSCLFILLGVRCLCIRTVIPAFAFHYYKELKSDRNLNYLNVHKNLGGEMRAVTFKGTKQDYTML